MLDIAAGAAQDSAGNPNVVTEQCSHRRGHCGSDSDHQQRQVSAPVAVPLERFAREAKSLHPVRAGRRSQLRDLIRTVHADCVVCSSTPTPTRRGPR